MKKCCQCDKPSIPGLAPTQGLCQYHWNVHAFGLEWANKIRDEHCDYCAAIQRMTGNHQCPLHG
jgi:hypothetical protein